LQRRIETASRDGRYWRYVSFQAIIHSVISAPVAADCFPSSSQFPLSPAPAWSLNLQLQLHLLHFLLAFNTRCRNSSNPVNSSDLKVRSLNAAEGTRRSIVPRWCVLNPNRSTVETSAVLEPHSRPPGPDLLGFEPIFRCVTADG
jgi:hypothetical protein